MVVDSLSYQYLVGAEVDFEEGLQVPAFWLETPMPGLPAVVAHRLPYKLRT